MNYVLALLPRFNFHTYHLDVQVCSQVGIFPNSDVSRGIDAMV